MGCCPDDCGTHLEAKRWFSFDACGIVCACITWMLLLFAEYAIMKTVVLPWMGGTYQGLFHGSVFTSIIVLALWSHLKAMTTDPGAVPLKALPVDYEPVSKTPYRVCRKCESFKPERAHHCSFCNRCIVKMDHHCPWVNNCVALGNHKFFLLFIFYVFLSSVYAIGLIMSRFIHCSGTHRMKASQVPVECQIQVSNTLMMFGVVIEAVLFGLFTLCMMCDQWSVVIYSMTQIDRLKGEKISKRTKCESLTEVFGGEPRFSPLWFIPVSVRHLDHERVYGYRILSNQELEMASKSIQASKSPEDLENGESSVFIGTDPSQAGANATAKQRIQGGKQYTSVPSTGEDAV